MNNQTISITMAEADVFAMEYFAKICGLNREGDKYQRMLKQGMEIKERIRDSVEIKAVISSFPGNSIKDNTAVFNGVPFHCNAFQRFDPAHVLCVYVYILTAGIFELEDDEPILDQLYADIWGTAYVDAGIEILKKYVENDLEGKHTDHEKITVLSSFGPGFYGMDVNQISSFFEVLDGNKIGVHARSNSLMLPLKSCAGFYVAVDDKTDLPDSDCESCQSEYKNCAFCKTVVKGTQLINMGGGSY